MRKTNPPNVSRTRCVMRHLTRGKNMKRFSLGVILVASLLLFCAAGRAEYLEPIKNPYYRTPEWRLWYRDQTPIPSPALIAPGQVGQIAPPPESARLYPDDADTKAKPGSFLAFRKTDWPGPIRRLLGRCLPQRGPESRWPAAVSA